MFGSFLHPSSSSLFVNGHWVNLSIDMVTRNSIIALRCHSHATDLCSILRVLIHFTARTVNGDACALPFTYKGITYSNCTTVDHPRLWCSIDSIYNGRWAECASYECNPITTTPSPGVTNAQQLCSKQQTFLTHWGRDKMAAIFQTTFSNVFSWMKMYEFRLRFHLCLCLRVQLTIFQHWFR